MIKTPLLPVVVIATWIVPWFWIHGEIPSVRCCTVPSFYEVRTDDAAPQFHQSTIDSICIIVPPSSSSTDHPILLVSTNERHLPTTEEHQNQPKFHFSPSPPWSNWSRQEQPNPSVKQQQQQQQQQQERNKLSLFALRGPPSISIDRSR